MTLMQEGSEYDRLFYPFLFKGGQVDAAEVLAQVRHSTLEKCHEVTALRQVVLEAYRDRLIAAGQAMAQAFAKGATLFAFGNGGSATDAQDLMADLVSPARPDVPSLPAMALTNDIAVVTAVGNDVGFDKVFSRQLIAFARPGDIAVGISTSGNSANILAAFKQAKTQGLLTVGLAGYGGGDMVRSKAVDYCFIIPSNNIPRIQEAQATVYHTLIELVQALLTDKGKDEPF